MRELALLYMLNPPSSGFGTVCLSVVPAFSPLSLPSGFSLEEPRLTSLDLAPTLTYCPSFSRRCPVVPPRWGQAGRTQEGASQAVWKRDLTREASEGGLRRRHLGCPELREQGKTFKEWPQYSVACSIPILPPHRQCLPERGPAWIVWIAAAPLLGRGRGRPPTTTRRTRRRRGRRSAAGRSPTGSTLRCQAGRGRRATTSSTGWIWWRRSRTGRTRGRTARGWRPARRRWTRTRQTTRSR